MKEFIEYAGRYNAYYKEALMNAYGRYRDMSKEELLLEHVKAKKRDKGLGTNVGVADCMIIYELLKQKEDVCLKD